MKGDHYQSSFEAPLLLADPKKGETWETGKMKTRVGQVLDVANGKVLMLMRSTGSHRLVALPEFKLKWRKVDTK